MGTIASMDTQNNNLPSTPTSEPKGINATQINQVDVWRNLEKEAAEVLANNTVKYNRNTTDLVRLYLQDIGRVPLLRRDEEITEAQRVKDYVNLRQICAAAASEGDTLMSKLVELLEIHDRLVSQLGHGPSLNRWAMAAEMEVSQLKQIVARGKRRWAEIALCDVGELEAIKKAGIKAKEHMIKANLRLVVSVAKRYQNRGLELLDLIQEGTLGLERSVEKFEPSQGYRFSTYAYWWIRQGITRAIATQSRTIRLPLHMTEKLNKIKKAQRTISQRKGRTATMEEIGKELDMTPGQVREVLMIIPRSVSLEIKVGKDKDTELGDLLVTEKASPEEVLIREGLQKDLQLLLADLTTREREVIQMRYGLTDGQFYSFGDIAKVLKLSRERIRQIEIKALQKLQQPKCRNRVRDYLELLN